MHSLGEKNLATIGDNLADFLRIFRAKSTISQTIKIAKTGKFIFHKFQHNAHLLFLYDHFWKRVGGGGERGGKGVRKGAREFFHYYFFISDGECRFSKIGTPVPYVDTIQRTLFQNNQ